MAELENLDFRALFESAPGLYLVLTPDLTIAAVSNAYLCATMTRREDILGRALFEVFPDNPDDQGATGASNLRASLQRVLELRAADAMPVQKYDIRRPAEEGGGFEERFWSPVNSPVLAADGTVSFIVHEVEDVTELMRLEQRGSEQRKQNAELTQRTDQMAAEVYERAQELQRANEQLRELQAELESRVETRTTALRASEDRFAKLAHSGIIGIAITGASGKLVDVNEACSQILGYSQEELLSGPFGLAQLTAPEWRHTDAAAFEQLQARGIAPAWEKEFLRKDGTRAPVLIAVTLLDGDSRMALFSDLTERKRAEDALKKTEAQLLQAQKMEAVGRLAGGVAHDFNNLLSVVLSYAELALSALRPDDPVRADLGEIRTAGQRATALTRQLLAFSRQQVLQPRVLDLNAVLADMENMLRRLLGADVELAISPSPSLDRVRADPGQVAQIIMNLAVNARDAMPTGGRLAIATSNVVLDEAYAREHHGVTPGPHVKLAVSDTGVGMDDVTRARAFEPFFTTKDKTKGTGLGLSTVLGIVQQSGGYVRIDSATGKGTTLEVYLPRVEDVVVLERPPVPISASERGSETILLVEDEAQVRTVARGILVRAGYQVLEANNGGEALLICERSAGVIDLLLTDVVLPHMSGRELSERVAPLRPDMRVLFMSGYTDDAVLRHGVQAGTPFLQKPFTPETLRRKVREVLELRSVQRPA